MPQFSNPSTGTGSSTHIVFWESCHPAVVRLPMRSLRLLWIVVAAFHCFSAQLSNDRLEELDAPDAPKVGTQKVQSIMDAYSVALQTIPNPPGLNLQFGVRLWELGAVTESHQAFQRELTINPGNVRAQVMLAVIKVQQHRYAEAAGELRALIEKDPSLTQVWHPLGRALFESGKFDEARQCLEKAAAVDPGVAQVQALLAKTYARLSDSGNAERASALCFQALKLKRARDAAGLGQWSAALHLVNEYLAAFPLSSDGLYTKAGILFNGYRSLDSAMMTVRDSIRQNASNLEARNLLAALLLAKRDFVAFEQEARAILQMDPLDGHANYYLGRFEYDRKRPGEAREYLERARLVQPNDTLIATTLAMTYEGLGLNPDAEEEYKRGIERSRNGARDSYLYSNYGAFLVNHDRVTEALPYLDAATASPTVRPEAWYIAGIAHLQSGEVAVAKRCLEKAIDQRPDYAEARSALEGIRQREGGTIDVLREPAMGKKAGDNARLNGTKNMPVENISLPQ